MTSEPKVDRICGNFESALRGLVLAREIPLNSELRSLDLKLRLHAQHVCWQYSTRSQKSLLPFPSAHSKVVKCGIAQGALRNALQKSCHHLVPESFKEQESRVKIAGFPDCLIKSLSGIFLKEIREGRPEKNPNREKEGMAIISYLHGVSHKLMKTGRKCGVRDVLRPQQAFPALQKGEQRWPKFWSLCG